nr:hypothetical protein [Tanacetum cinerariifolium]
MFCPGLRFVKHCVLLKPNSEALRKCILSGPYKPITILVQAVDAADDSPAVPEHTTVETPMNMSPENKAHFLAEKEAIHQILTGIGDKINSIVDACQTAQEMWEAIERLHQAQRDKDMQKNLALIAKYFKKIYKPTNNNLRTSSNSKNKNVDTTSREFGHFAKECRKPKRVKDPAYHKEKMLLCKQAKQGVPLQAEQYDWLPDTDEEFDEQELEAHYSYMAKIQEVPTETDDSNIIPNSPDMCEDEIQNDQNDVESDDERVNHNTNVSSLQLKSNQSRDKVMPNNSQVKVKENQENDKIGSKPDKNGRHGEARKSLKQLQ